MKCAIVLNTPVSRPEEGSSPRRDYLLLADALNADIIAPEPLAGRSGLKSRFASYFGQAWAAFQRRHQYDVLLTMSEQVGLVLALLLKLSRSRTTHVMVSHYLTPARKSLFVSWLHVESHISRFICYGTAQARFLTETLHVPCGKVDVVLHPADAQFWRPMPVPSERMIASGGLLARDYETLLRAVDGLDVDVTIAADSPWVNGGRKQPSGPLPDRVRFVRCTPREMRELYARSLFVVVPLVPVNIQAGSLVIYESMAMGKAVITTANGGNLDIIQDGETGIYVPPQDSAALRKAIVRLLDDPAEAQRMGAAARRTVEQRLNLDVYVQRVADIVKHAHQQGQPRNELAASHAS